jgi:hypothetical protein
MSAFRLKYEWVLETYNGDPNNPDSDIIEHDHEEGRPDRLLSKYLELREAGEHVAFGVNCWKLKVSGKETVDDLAYETFYCDDEMRFGTDLPARKAKQLELDSALRRLESETQLKSEDTLCDEWQQWCELHGLECLSADEMEYEDLSEEQRTYVHNFIMSWIEAMGGIGV